MADKMYVVVSVMFCGHRNDKVLSTLKIILLKIISLMT